MPHTVGPSLVLSEKQKNKLLALLSKNELAPTILGALATIRQPRQTIDLRRLRDRIYEHTGSRLYIDQRHLRDFFVEMAGIGLGKVAPGSGVNPDRFVWTLHMRSVVDAVAEHLTPAAESGSPSRAAPAEEVGPDEGIVIRFKWAGQQRVLPYGRDVKGSEIDNLMAILEMIRKTR